MARQTDDTAETLAASDQLDRQLAKACLQKQRGGAKTTREERAALRRVQKAQEKTRREQYYRTIPKSDYRLLAGGRAARTLNEQAVRYRIPIQGPTVDLYALIQWLHQFLADNRHKLVAESGDVLLEGASQALKDEYVRTQILEKREKAELARMDRLEREGALLPKEMVREFNARLATVLRTAGDVLQREFGPDAARVVNEALENLAREVRSLNGASDNSNDLAP